MPSSVIVRARGPRPACVVVRCAAAGDTRRQASIEVWTRGGNALTPQPTADADLTRVLKLASDVSGKLGFHWSYEFADDPDHVAAYVQTWPERCAALDEVRAQRARLKAEASMGEHRADGSCKTEIERACAAAMLKRLTSLCECLMQRGFTRGAGAIDDRAMPPGPEGS